MLTAIDEIIRQDVDPQGPGIAVAVVQDGRMVHSAGYGLANLEWGCPIQPNTVFRLASITKQFTATAILLLEQQGKLRLDEPITTYLPDYPTHGRTITITHLLNHTSGIPSYTNLATFLQEIAKKDMQPPDLLTSFKDLPLEFEPGERFAYNNSGYHLLGLLIEQVAEMSYEQFIQQHIFQPLGMNHSYYMHNETIIPNRASGYSKTKQGYQQAEYLNMWIPYAAGSLGSTVEDLARWDAGMREERLLDKATQERMYTPTILSDGSTEPYGFGVGISEYGDRRLIQHGGGIPGFHTFISRFVDKQVMIAILANTGETDVEKITRGIARHLFSLPAITRTPITLDVATLDKAVGTYAVEHNFAVTVEREGEQLLLQSPFNENLLPLTSTTYYFSKDQEVEIHFSEERDGTFHALAMHIPFYRPFKASRKEA